MTTVHCELDIPARGENPETHIEAASHGGMAALLVRQPGRDDVHVELTVRELRDVIGAIELTMRELLRDYAARPHPGNATKTAQR